MALVPVASGTHGPVVRDGLAEALRWLLVITGVFFILYAALRIIGEMFRVPDPAWSWLGLSAGQALSLWMFIVGAAFIGWGFRTRQYEPAFRS